MLGISPRKIQYRLKEYSGKADPTKQPEEVEGADRPPRKSTS